MEDIEDVFEGWLERPTEDNDQKGWLKKSFSKKWKKGFYVLRKYCSGDQAFIQWFDKEENWRRQIAKGTLELFPQYRVLKRAEMKGKQFVFEVNNDSDTYILAAESEMVMDLWVVQLQMQTRLNPRVAGKTYRIQCCGNKAMQRIGAKDQKCLLHISKWGITLALERTRAVLAQWPLTTIRNYECMDRCEFSFESGRRSPMGPGKYTFYTQPGEDNRIFDTIDKFATERLQAQSRAGAGVVANSEEDMSRAYDQLRFSVLNIPAGNLEDDYDMAGSAPRSIQGAEMMGSYSHLGRSDSIGSGPSIGSFATSLDPSYNSVDRHSSFGSRSEAPQGASNYDFLDHARSQISLSVKEGHRGFSRSTSGYNHISSSSFRGTPDYFRKDMCPLELSPESDSARSNDLSSPVSPSSTLPSETNDDQFAMSGEFSGSPEEPESSADGATSTSTLNEEEVPPPLPDRASRVPLQNTGVPPASPEKMRPLRDRPLPPPPPPDDESPSSNPGLPERGKTLPAFGSKKYNQTKPTKNSEKSTEYPQMSDQNNFSATSTSPNFVYLNSAYSKSVEVLPQLYATVDKTKKKKNREMAERRRLEYEASKLARAKKKSRSHESLAGSPPRLNSFSFTPFSFKGLAAMDSSSEEDFSKDEDFDIPEALISAKLPKSERVSMALKGSLKRDDNLEDKGEVRVVNNGLASSLPKEVETLHKVIAQSSPRVGSKTKPKQTAEHSV